MNSLNRQDAKTPRGRTDGKAPKLARFWSILLPSLIILSTLMGSRSFANTFDASFYRRIERIVIVSSGNVWKDNLISKLFVKNFPLSNEQLDDLVVSRIDKAIEGAKNLEVMSARDNRNLTHRPADKGKKIFIHVNTTLWDKNKFSPSLNHDVVIIKMKYILPPKDEGATTREIPLDTLLVSLKDDRDDISDKIGDAIDETFAEYLIPYIVCAHGGDCSGL